MNDLPRVMVAVPCDETGGYRPFDVVLAQFLKQTPNADVRYGMTGVVVGARNRLVRMALAENWDYIWWLDDDQPFNPGGPQSPQPIGDFEKLMAHGVDAIVPLSLRRRAPFTPLLFDALSDDGHARQHWLSDHERGLIPVAGAGFAGLLIKTECFRKIGTDGWFEFVHPPENFDDYAEDFPFYQKLAAAGYQLHCDLEVRFGHAVTSVAYPVRQHGKWMTVLADHEPFVAFPQPTHPLLAETAARKLVSV